MRVLPLLATACVAAGLTAQTVTLRGKIEDVSGPGNQFVIDGTNLTAVSSALNLNAWVGQQAILQVVDVGTPTAPVIRVDAAVATTKVMDMGNLRLGESKTFEVNAPQGSAAFMFMDFQSNTGFTPAGSLGTWLLGPSPYLLAGGITNSQNQFEVQFTTPNNPQLLGLRITSQALVGDHGNWFFSNPDNKTVEQ
jgi:hypothetical protein